MAKRSDTPMMQQYYQIKDQYPDAILFYRLGDFYEMFEEDALVASKELEITLTSRNKKADHPVAMCGVPYHSATDYIRRLIQAGYKVAICEQLEDPKVTKGMVKRDVVRVITPGTVLEDTALDQKKSNYLAALSKQEGTYTLIYTDISTGKTRLTHTNDWTQFVSELQTIQASEWLYDPSDLNGLTQQEFEGLQASLTSYQSAFHAQAESPYHFFRLEDAQPHEAALLDYLSQYLWATQKQSLDYLQEVDRYELSQYLQMNLYTKTQLELTESLRTKRRKGSLLWLIDQTQTAMGGRLLHQWLDKPLLKKAPLLDRHRKVKAMIDHYFDRVNLVETLKSVYDLERLVTKISLKTVNARELDQLRATLRQIPALNQSLDRMNQEEDGLFEGLPTFTDLLDRLDQVLVEEPPISVAEGRLIKPGYHETLDQYRQALDQGQTWLLDLQARERERTGLKTLKVGYNKVFGYYIEVSRIQAKDLEDDRYIRKQTLTNNERFITEELKEIETKILTAQDQATALEYQLFVDLRDQVNQYGQSLQDLAQRVAELDVLASFAALSEADQFVQAEIVDQAKDWHIEASRHPVLEQVLGSQKFVANDVVIQPDQFVLLLTGPNMSGKSTYMRQIAFCVILNQIGCFVPAKSASLPLVDQIFTRIGASDDLTSGQSTFMVEMVETNYALQHATERSLILFDEIGRGTATFDGMALAEAILYYLCQKVQAATIFSTHYHELVDLTDRLDALRNIHVGAIEEYGQLVFLYKILQGPADKSYGLHVARLAGLPDDLINHSQEVLNELESQAQNLRKPNNQAIPLFNLPAQPAKASPSQVEADLEAADLNTMTPLDALNFLAQLKGQLKSQDKE